MKVKWLVNVIIPILYRILLKYNILTVKAINFLKPPNSIFNKMKKATSRHSFAMAAAGE